MIITRTPLRISLFGGGTDYPEWYLEHGGSVIGMAIDKYVYVTAMPLSAIHPYKFRLYWSKIERCQRPEEIEHPVVREVLRREDNPEPCGYSIIADLPARNGLGSSSAFTVGFLCGYYQGLLPYEFAEEAIKVERYWLGEAGGHQDQYFAAFGGFSRFDFRRSGPVIHQYTTLGKITQNYIASCLFLVHTGVSRIASEISEEQAKNTRNGEISACLHATQELTEHAWKRLHSPDMIIAELGALLSQQWAIKKRYSPLVTSPRVDELYDACMKAGAVGGKLCGAGWGGFLCMVVPPERQERFQREVKAPIVQVGIDEQGSTVIWPPPAT